MKKCLIIATTAYMIRQFELENIKILQNLGYKVDIAVNFSSSINPMSDVAISEFKSYLDENNIDYYEIPFLNNVVRIDRHIMAYYRLKALMEKNRYDMCHVHTPFAAAIGRLVAFRVKVPKKIYTAHGFHFFKGGPLKNWLIFYPIECILSRITDILIVINKGDYEIAIEKFKTPQVHKINGVGIDIAKITSQMANREKIRQKYSVEDDETVLLSVGELNLNKNHEVIIQAMAKLNLPAIKYFIVGEGHYRAALQRKIVENQLQENVYLLGYLKDVQDILPLGDIFCFPSRREGLGLAALEGMSCGLPLLTSNVGGINDYMEDGKTGYRYDPLDSEGFAQGIEKLLDKDLRKKIGSYNQYVALKYDKLKINEKMKEIYRR